MKGLSLILLFLGVNLAIGQSLDSEPIVAIGTNDIRVEGTDALGAHVTVVYNNDKVKVYQERTLNGETTYAHFDKGAVVEYGTIVKPALVTSEIRLNETDEP